MKLSAKAAPVALAVVLLTLSACASTSPEVTYPTTVSGMEAGAGRMSLAYAMAAVNPDATPDRHKQDVPADPVELALGFMVDDLSFARAQELEVPASRGVEVVRVDPASEAYQEGSLRDGAVIVELAGETIRDRDDFLRVYRAIPSDAYFLAIGYLPGQDGPKMIGLIKSCPGC